MIAFPQYLDVPMLVSTLAALEDGVESSATLASLGIDLEGRVGSDAAPTAANAIRQRHTVASLFTRLRDSLGDRIQTISAPADLEALDHGAFVELSGALTRNPIIEFVNVMERLFAIAQVPPVQGTAGAAGLDTGVPEETRQVFNALRDELDSSPVVNATLTTAGEVRSVLSLQRSYLSHDSLDDLRFGKVRVLGKAVGTLSGDERWSLISRSFVGHMVSGAFEEAMHGLQEVNPSGDYPIITDVAAPAVFVVPLAVFV